jgi:hypothetical protein
LIPLGRTFGPGRSVLAAGDLVLHGPGLVVRFRLGDATEEIRDLASAVDSPFAHEFREVIARALRWESAQSFPGFRGELFGTW